MTANGSAREGKPAGTTALEMVEEGRCVYAGTRKPNQTMLSK